MHTEEQSRRFQIPLGKGRFRNASFSWRICVDSGSRRRNKAAFFKFPPRCGLGVSGKLKKL